MTGAEERCKLCPKTKAAVSGTWICCDVCETWYHVRCLGMSIDEFEVIDSYHCADCAPSAGPSTLLRKSSRKPGKINYADLVNGIVSHQSKWKGLLESHQFLPDKFRRVEGKDLTTDWLRQTGFKEPVIVKRDNDGSTDGLDMKMPPSSLTVDDVRDAVGQDTPVEVIDVATQSELLDWNMGGWAEYFKSEPKERVYNVISLEISGSPLAEQVQRPRVVRELDWIDNFWPEELKATEFPKVQLYCLMSVKDSFTDFHVDFAGSSVFYHILSGSKTFYFVEPTSTHLRKYAKWSSSSDQSTTFFGDEVAGKCHKVELVAGDTMLIPAGWIHSVYTPLSSVVIGGNFIHSLHIPMQYKAAAIEMETNVPPKFRFPFFEKLNWFVALGCYQRGQDYLSALSNTELEGLMALTSHLFNRQKSLKLDPLLSKDERHMIRASVPAEAASFAHEGSLGLLRRLNRQVCTILEGQGRSVDKTLRLLTEEEEKVAEMNKPKIKLTIKLNSTPSSTHSGDEESNQGEQQVPVAAAVAHTAPKLKFKLSAIKAAVPAPPFKAAPTSASKVKVESDDDLSDGSELDLSTDDGEWDDFETEIDEGFDEAKDIEDDGGLEPGSSDSEYDEDTPKRSRARKQSTPVERAKKNSDPHHASKSVPSVPVTLGTGGVSRAKKSSSDTVFFDDGEDQDLGKGASDDEDEVILGLGKKRKAPALAMTPVSTMVKNNSPPYRIGEIHSLGGLASSLPMGGPPLKKKSTSKASTGGTAKDRIRSLLQKRR